MRIPAGINLKSVTALIFLSLFAFMLGNNVMALTNSDEVFYVQTAREMQHFSSWATPYLFDQPQFEKPPLFYWFLRLAYKILGFSPFAARFFPALFGCIGVLAVYLLGLVGFKEERKAFTCALVLMSSFLYLGMAKVALTDTIFSVFVLLSLAVFFWGYVYPQRKSLSLILAGVFSGLAVLTKGPLGIILPALVILVFLFLRRELKYLWCRQVLPGVVAFAAISLPWHMIMLAKYKEWFVNEFFYNVHIRRVLEAEHRQHDVWSYYPAIFFFGMFPWSIFTIAGLRDLFWPQKDRSAFSLFLLTWIAVIFVFFQAAHSKLASYILPIFPAVALVTGEFIWGLVNMPDKRRVFLLFLFSSLFFLGLVYFFCVLVALSLNYFLSRQVFIGLIAVAFIIVLAQIVICIVRDARLKAASALACGSIFLVSLMIFFANDIDPIYAFSRQGCDYLMRNYNVGGTILSSDKLVRDVRFNTGKQVAMLSPDKDEFWSQHPVTILNSDNQIRSFVAKNSPLYCILTKGDFRMLSKKMLPGLKISVLKDFRHYYAVRLEMSGP